MEGREGADVPPRKTNSHSREGRVRRKKGRGEKGSLCLVQTETFARDHDMARRYDPFFSGKEFS